MKNKKTIAVLSIGRTDYSYFKPILAEIKKHKDLGYFLIVAGMHLSKKFGSSYKEIIEDGFVIHKKCDVTLSPTPRGAAQTSGLMTLKMAEILSRGNIDLLLVLGDRFETLAACCACIPFNMPIAHICGGDVTEGQFDEQIRHAITKISHLHFASNKLSAARILQMGEETWRVFNAGLASIDTMKHIKLYSRNDFIKKYNLDPAKRTFLVTFHPVTLHTTDTDYYVNNLIKAIGKFNANIIITYPNSDPGSEAIIRRLKTFAAENKCVRLLKNLGIKGYYSAMKHSDLMIGNSSSGILESSYFHLGVVNIGNRQKNRLSGGNVINAGYGVADIKKSINFALSMEFQNKLKKIDNPYGRGDASKKIIRTIKHIVNTGNRQLLITKKFINK